MLPWIFKYALKLTENKKDTKQKHTQKNVLGKKNQRNHVAKDSDGFRVALTNQRKKVMPGCQLYRAISKKQLRKGWIYLVRAHVPAKANNDKFWCNPTTQGIDF